MIVLVIMLFLVGLMILLIALTIYSIAIALTIATFLLGHWLKNTLYNYDRATNKTTPSKLKIVAYISLFSTAPSVLVYFYAHNSVVALVETIIGPAVAIITFLHVIICIVDIILKIICYYYAIKAIFVAKCTVMTDTPEPLPVVPKIKTTSSKYCPKCNKQVNEAMLFCPDCGYKLLNK